MGLFFELFRILGGEVVCLTIFVAPLLDLRMAHEVVFETLCHVFALWDDADTCRQVFQDLRHEQRIMGAAEDDGIDLGVETHDLVDALLDEVVGTGGVGLVVFHEGHPEGTGDACDLQVGMEFVDLQIVTFTLDGALGGEYAHMTAFRQAADNFCRGADNAQHTALRVDLRQIHLLDWRVNS